MLLTSLTNFKNYINKDNATDDFVIEKLIMASSSDAENFTTKRLRGRTYGSNGLPAEFHNGNGTELMFPKEYPIISVGSLYDDTNRSFGSGTLKTASDYTIFSDEGMIQLNNNAVLGTVFNKGTANIKLIYTAGYDEFKIIGGRNDRLDFEETGSSELTATIAEGVYTASGLATVIDTALTAAGASVYTIIYDYFNSKFTFTSDRAGGSGTFKILWNTGTNQYRSIARLIGFQDDADDSDAASHTSDDSVLGIPGDLELAVLEIAHKKYNESNIGKKRAGLKSKAISGQNAGTTTYIIDAIPPHAKEILMNYQRHLV